MAGLRIYDVNTDDYRDATQVDLDQLMAVAASRGKIVAFIEQEQARLSVELKLIRSKAGVPASSAPPELGGAELAKMTAGLLGLSP